MMMSLFVRVPLVVVLAPIVVGCGSDPGAEATSACRARVDATCDYIYECYEGEELLELEVALRISSASRCTADLGASLCDGVAAAIDEGRQLQAPGQPAACLDAIAEAGCVSNADFFYHPDIELACQVTIGQVEVGGACLVSEDCAGDYGYCNESSVCELRGAPDYVVECTKNDQCSWLCIRLAENEQGKTGVCTEECVQGSLECGAGAACIGFGSGGRCVASCIDDDDCDNGFACINNDPVGYCLIRLTPGEL